MDLFTNRSDAVVRGAVERRHEIFGTGRGSKRKGTVSRGAGTNTNPAPLPPAGRTQPYTQAEMDNIIRSVEANNQYRASSITDQYHHYADAADTVYRVNEPPGTGVFGMAGNSADAEADRGIFTNIATMERAGLVDQTISDSLNPFETEMTSNPKIWSSISDNVRGQMAVMENARQSGVSAEQAMDMVAEQAVRRQLSQQYGPNVLEYYDQTKRQQTANRTPVSLSNSRVSLDHEQPGPNERNTHTTHDYNTVRDGVRPRLNENVGGENQPPVGLENLDPNNPWFRPIDTGARVQRLGCILDEINMEKLWNGRTFRTTLGSFTYSLVRLFTTRYERTEETTAIDMIREAMVRGSLAAGDPRYVSTTDYWDVYRMRAGFILGWAKFRRLLEEMELKEYITRKHKTDLNMLYILLSSSDVRLFRDATDSESVSYFDPITGYELRTPPLLNQPLVIDIHMRDMFGNIARSTKLLDRSINTASNNAKRKREPTSEGEILALLEMSVPLLMEEATGYDDIMPARIERETEHATLRDMLANTMVVSMMAEEFRVFVGDMQAPPTADSKQTTNKKIATVPTGVGKTVTSGATLTLDQGGKANTHSDTDGLGLNAMDALPKSARHRKPIFYTFTKSTNPGSFIRKQ